jgi:hypothetical protein
VTGDGEETGGCCAGALLFARYAFPPNERGLCGPDDRAALRGHVAAGVAGPGLVNLARGFDGAWPYLQLIAAANRIADPLERRVVEAYWVGNRLLDNVRISDYGAFLDERFRGRAGRDWENIARALPLGAVPHHSFHVFGVYPWSRLLGRGMDEPLHVLDNCRIRWGSVLSRSDEEMVVSSRRLSWDGAALGLLPPSVERVRFTADDGAAGAVVVGDRVALHWDRYCDRLDAEQVAALERSTARELAATNRRLAG